MIMKLGLGKSVVDVNRGEEIGVEAQVSETAGTYLCQVCGETVKAADFGASLFHQRPNHKAGDRRR